MVSRPTVADVAREAGVSVATVDRVVNGRLPVREDTARRVLEAAQRISFHAVGLIRSRLREQLPEVAVGVLLQRPDEPFYADLTRQLQRAITGARAFRGVSRLDYWVKDDPEDIAARLRRLARRCQAVALVSPDHPAVAAAIADVAGTGLPVFTMLSDCAPASRTSYLGIDSRKAGRTAAWLIRKCAPRGGKVAVIVGSRRFQGHELREMGFRSFFREVAPEFVVLDAVVNSESDAATEEAILQLAERHRDLVGIYLAGGGAAGGVAALRAIEPGRRPAMICPSLQPEVRAALADGVLTAAICEPVDRLTERLVEAVTQALDEQGPRVPNQIVLPMDLYTPENL
ncbi:MAG: LacI family DNA-binding transcriptional regulator [Amaricoccus sp.]|uniref:LacI family DNA-binding transcriptional regulator n=1 Tax=Amaricoccus sp. TaxID=1872485 RepID=UPI0039E6051C